MRPAIILAIAVMALGHAALPVGATFAAAEANRIPAVLAAVALMALRRGPRALPAAGAWMLLGAAAAVLLRQAAGFPAPAGSIPGPVTSRMEAFCDIAWLLAIAALAWRGVPPRLTGPVVSAVVATTPAGGYGQALLPVLWEDTARDAMAMGIGVSAGLLAGVAVFLVAGWAVSILARVAERWIAPRRVLSALAVAAALGHMLKA